MDQPKVLRELKLMIMLVNNKYSTIESICQKLDISIRTFHRYVDTFRSAHFCSISVQNGIYRLQINHDFSKNLCDVVQLSKEEALQLRKWIESLDAADPLKQNLMEKFSSLFDYHFFSDVEIYGENTAFINELNTAIQQNKQVKINGYFFDEYEGVSEIKVEPFRILPCMNRVWCYDLFSKTCRLIPISRIKSVTRMRRSWQNIDKHHEQDVDIFYMEGILKYPVEVKMTRRAAMALQEQWPMSRLSLHRKKDDSFLLKTRLCDLYPLADFIIKLIDDVEIVESAILRECVREKILNLQHAVSRI